jgi:hypothetical protein
LAEGLGKDHAAGAVVGQIHAQVRLAWNLVRPRYRDRAARHTSLHNLYVFSPDVNSDAGGHAFQSTRPQVKFSIFDFRFSIELLTRRNRKPKTPNLKSPRATFLIFDLRLSFQPDAIEN